MFSRRFVSYAKYIIQGFKTITIRQPTPTVLQTGNVIVSRVKYAAPRIYYLVSSEIFLRVPLNKSKLNGRGGSTYKYEDARKANHRRDTMLSSWSSNKKRPRFMLEASPLPNREPDCGAFGSRIESSLFIFPFPGQQCRNGLF